MMVGECLKHMRSWFYICLALIFVILAGLVMIFRYFLKINRKGVVLEQKGKEHETKHEDNCRRIEKLEEKNGAEMKKIEELNTEIRILKQIIYDNQDRDRKQNRDTEK